MDRDDELVAHVRELLDANLYLTLGTADADGAPWTTPVYFAPGAAGDLYWVSAVDALHSRHLARRPGAGLVVFDSTVPPYHGRALYGTGVAAEVPGAELDRALTFYPRPDAQGAAPLTAADVTAPAGYRLYRATVSRLWVLCPREPRRPCPRHDRAEDHRTAVPIRW